MSLGLNRVTEESRGGKRAPSRLKMNRWRGAVKVGDETG